MSGTYIFTFGRYDRAGIDEEDARLVAAMLQKEWPNEKFSSGIVHGVLGIRIETYLPEMRLSELAEYRAFAKGAMATRQRWER